MITTREKINKIIDKLESDMDIKMGKFVMKDLLSMGDQDKKHLTFLAIQTTLGVGLAKFLAITRDMYEKQGTKFDTEGAVIVSFEIILGKLGLDPDKILKIRMPMSRKKKNKVGNNHAKKRR
jgi:hypothetical protein